MRQILSKLLQQKGFGPLPASIEKRIEQADQATLEAWLDQVIPAASVQALFGDVI